MNRAILPLLGGRRITRRSFTRDLNWARSGVVPLTFERTQFPGPRCIVLLAGALREMPRIAPLGVRVVCTTGNYTTAATSGKSVLVTAGGLVESTSESAVATP